MSRIHYTGQNRRAPSRSAVLLLAGSLALPGCSMSVPMLGDAGPATTGSVATAVEVQKPLPPTLAYSDATKIGQTAAAALWRAVDDGEGREWVNAATGSSGTIEERRRAEEAGECRGFDTMVTSIGGVHSYSGQVCRKGNDRSVVEIGDPGESRSS